MEALAALRILSSALGKLDLKRLNLSDNALGEKGLRACKDAFQNQVTFVRSSATDRRYVCSAKGPLPDLTSLLVILDRCVAAL